MSAPPQDAGLPVVGRTFDMMRDQLGLHDEVVDRHGDLVRVTVLGVGEYCIAAHPDYVEQVLVTDRERFAKTDDFQVAFGDSVLTVEGDRWETHREALNEFFFPQRIRSYADEMVELTERRVDRWTAGDAVGLYDELKQLTLENLFATLFDRRLEIGGDRRLRRAADDLNLFFRSTSYALPRWVPTPSRRRFEDAREALRSEAESLLAARRREGADGDDLLSTLVRAREAGDTPLDDGELVDDLVALIFAGHDTTAFAVTAALHQLGTHPEVRERFHAELDDVLDGERPTLDNVGDLAVTERVLDETLRRYPSVFQLPRRTTEPVELGGYRVPADTRVHLSPWRIHRDERFWDDPDEWRPARWRHTSRQEKGHAFVPFGAGRRTCIGRRFARLEAKLVLATVGRRFHLAPERPLGLEPEMTLSAKHGAPVRVEERG